MDLMNQKKILNKVTQLHNNAKNGTLKFNNNVYSIEFNRYMGNYAVYNSNRDIIIHGYNTRKISVAKKWLREYLIVNTA